MYEACLRLDTTLEGHQLLHLRRSPRETGTNSSPTGSSDYHIVLELQILIKHSIIKLDLTVKSISNPFPISSRVRHRFEAQRCTVSAYWNPRDSSDSLSVCSEWPMIKYRTCIACTNLENGVVALSIAVLSERLGYSSCRRAFYLDVT